MIKNKNNYWSNIWRVETSVAVARGSKRVSTLFLFLVHDKITKKYLTCYNLMKYCESFHYWILYQ